MSQEQLFASFILDHRTGIEIALPAAQVIEALPVAATLQPLPTAAPFFEGIMRLREDVIPVINLKKRLALAETDYCREAKVAVIRFNRKRYGLLVDDIRDVLRVPVACIEPLDGFLLSEQTVITDLIKLNRGRRTLELLDLGRLFLQDEAALEGTVDREQALPAERTYGRYVIFSCRDQVYGLPVGDVRELCFFADLDQTFKSGKVEGALQLRGRTIPVLSSVVLLGWAGEEPTPSEETRILVLQSGELTFGLIVDQVHQILVQAEDEVMAIPGGGHLPHLHGVCSSEKYRNIMLLDIMGLIAGQTEKISAMSRLRSRSDAGRGWGGAEPTVRHLITVHSFLVFTIGRHYAIELKDVQEIIDCSGLMPISTGSELVQGLINLRGRIVPVLSLRSFYPCPQRNMAADAPQPAGKLIIGRAGGNLLALLVDEIVTIYKQEQFHQTPSLRPELQSKKDTLDRLIEFINSEGLKEHVLVVNVGNILRNHLGIPDQEEGSEAAAGEDRGAEASPSLQ